MNAGRRPLRSVLGLLLGACLALPLSGAVAQAPPPPAAVAASSR